MIEFKKKRGFSPENLGSVAFWRFFAKKREVVLTTTHIWELKRDLKVLLQTWRWSCLEVQVTLSALSASVYVHPDQTSAGYSFYQQEF